LTSITVPFVGATLNGTSNAYFGYIFGASRSGEQNTYIPETLKAVIITGGATIVSNAFSDCTGLTGITIPDSVTSIGSNAFIGCTGLTAINVSSGNIVYSSQDGVLYNKDKTKLICYPAEKSDVSFTILSNVISIEENAFSGCNNLMNFIVPDGNKSYFSSLKNAVTIIGGSSISSSFANASNVTILNISDSITSFEELTLRNSSHSLTEINVSSGNTVYSSQDGVLYNKNKTTLIVCPKGKKGVLTIPNGVYGTAYYAFGQCTGITSINIPSSFNNIGFSSFEYNISLTEINVDTDNNSFSSENGVLYNKSKTRLIRYPEGKTGGFIIPSSVTIIEGGANSWNGAFSGCTGLTSVTIPDSVTNIGEYSFYGCKSLTSINIPDSVTRLDGGAFHNTTWYNNQPDGLVYAGKFAYKYKGTMPANTSITLLDGTKGITGFAFYGYTSLTSINIPDSVTNIGEQAFNFCSNLTSVTFFGTIPSSGFDSWAFGTSGYSGYVGDLREKFYATDAANGTPGTYTRPNTSSNTWTRTGG